MHTTRVPGFSAVASLSHSVARGQASWNLAEVRRERDIVPAMQCRSSAGGTWYCCGSDDLHFCTNIKGGYMVCGGRLCPPQ